MENYVKRVVLANTISVFKIRRKLNQNLNSFENKKKSGTHLRIVHIYDTLNMRRAYGIIGIEIEVYFCTMYNTNSLNVINFAAYTFCIRKNRMRRRNSEIERGGNNPNEKGINKNEFYACKKQIENTIIITQRKRRIKNRERDWLSMCVCVYEGEKESEKCQKTTTYNGSEMCLCVCKPIEKYLLRM